MREEQLNNLPTQERKEQAERKGEGLALVLHSNTNLYHAQIIDPLRIDKLFTAKIITKLEHRNAKKLYILHTLVERRFFPAVQYDDPAHRGMDKLSRNMVEEQKVIHMSCQDIFYDVISFLKKAGGHHHTLVDRVCLKEEAYTLVTRSLRIHPRKARTHLHNALGILAAAFDTVKEKQEALENILTSG